MGFTGAITRPRRCSRSCSSSSSCIAMLVMGIVGVVIERFAYRPLRNAPRLAPLITAIGVSFILQNIIFVGVSNSIVTVPKLIPFTVLHDRSDLRSAQINLFVIVLALVPHGRPAALHRREPASGTAMRSTAMDREAAQLMGVEHQHDHRHHVLHRLGAGRRGRRRPGPLLRHHRLQHRLPGRPQGLHRGRARRHRQHHRRRPRAAS